MKLYHASKNNFKLIKRNQVEVPEGISVPEGELQNKIYLTPDLGFAIAMASGPDGMTIVLDGTISFENESDFDPDQIVYVYEVDSEDIEAGLTEVIDDEQVAVDLDELSPSDVNQYKASEVFKYYDLVSWKHPNNS